MSTQKSGTARAETGSGERHRSARRFEAGAGLPTDQPSTQHPIAFVLSFAKLNALLAENRDFHALIFLMKQPVEPDE